MTTEREAFDAVFKSRWPEFEHPTTSAFELWQAACAWQREKDAEKAGVYAKQWWSKHCETNKHMETTRAAHEDFCALQNKIRSAE